MARPMMLGYTGGDVGTVHQRLLALGFDVPADEVRDDRFGHGTESSLRRFQVQAGLPLTAVVDDATALALGIDGARPRDVEGIVCQPDGTGIGGVTVQLIAQDLRGGTVVAETTSDPSGRFTLPWPDSAPSALLVRADGAVGKSLLPASANASGTVWARLSIGGEYRGPTRFSALMSRISPKLDRVALHTLRNTSDVPHRKTLSLATGIAEPEIDRLVLANGLAEVSRIDAAVFFALAAQHRQLAPDLGAAPAGTQQAEADEQRVEEALDAILLLPRDQVRRSLATAIADNVISETDVDVDAAVQQLHTLRVERIAEKPFGWTAPFVVAPEAPCCTYSGLPNSATPEDGGPPEVMRAAAPTVSLVPAAFRDILATSITDPEQKQRLYEVVAACPIDVDLWAELEARAGLPAEQLTALRFTLEVATLLGNHLSLVNAVQKLRNTGDVAAARDLARLDPADWATLLQDTASHDEGLSLAAATGDADVEATIEHVARVLALQLEARYPTAALTGRLANDSGELALESAAGVQRFLDESPSFCVQHTHVDRFLLDRRATLPMATEREIPPEVVSDLKKLQRLYKLSPRFSHAKAMLGAGHHSAYSVYATGRANFARAMTSAGATPTEADAIFDKAEQIHATTVALLGNFNNAFTQVAPSAVAQPLAVSSVQSTLVHFPTLQALFGSNDYCACEHCRAIYGPAAYLVDLLQFLKARPARTPFSHAADVLLGGPEGAPPPRRPDLSAIELSCDNTTGEVPYIDLVCEILEDAVSPQSPGAVRARQTRASLAELRASPAFVNEAAYTTLRTARFASTMSFDLYFAEVRALLRQLGVAWHELMAAYQVPPAVGVQSGPGDDQIAATRFGFSDIALADLVNDPAQGEAWNLQADNNAVPDPRAPGDSTRVIRGTFLAVLEYVPILLDRAKLRHRELVQILHARYINPTGSGRIIETAADGGFASCDTGQQTVAGLAGAWAARVSRFVRLWRQLAWPAWDLDKVLCTPSIIGDETDSLGRRTVAQLGHVDEVLARLGGPLDELLALWGDLDHLDYVNVLADAETVVPSVYRRRFRNATVTKTSAVFAEDATQLSGTLDTDDVVRGIAAALDISTADIRQIRVASQLGNGAALNLANLSTISRYAILAKRLALPIPDLLTAIAVTGVNPFPPTLSPKATLQFLTALNQIRDSGFTQPELSYLLLHQAVLDSGIGLTDPTIIGWLEDLRRDIVRLGTTVPEAIEELVTQRLSALLSLDPMVTRQALQATVPGANASMAAQFAGSSLTGRNESGMFVAAVTRDAFGQLFDACTVLHKLRTVVTRWRLTTLDALWILTNAATAGWLELTSLPASQAAVSTSAANFSKLYALRKNVEMQQALATASGARLFDFVADPNLTFVDAVSEFAQLGEWTRADIFSLASRLTLTTPAALFANAVRIRDMMTWPRRLGTDVFTLEKLATGNAMTNLGPETAQLVRQLAKAKYTLVEWLRIAASIQDDLREQKRAALVAWLLMHPDPARGQQWGTLEELYGYYLIDPEMSASATTTRIKQAAASIQLFVQRSFLQLEPSVSVNDDVAGWQQWDWMKRFRLWEANRKVFLYPENWIDPSLRGTKSQFFREFESELEQTDLTSELAEEALRNYLHKLDDVSSLEICGFCAQEDTTPPVLHVVGRTRKAPHVHYYRRQEPSGAWLPWEKIDVEIGGNHIMPVIWNHRLYIFWMKFSSKSLPARPQDRVVPTTGGATASEPTAYWEMTVAWSERRADRWTPTRQSQRAQVGFATTPPQTWVFRISAEGRTLTINGYRGDLRDANFLHCMRWEFAGLQDEPSLSQVELGALAAVDDAQYIVGLTPGQAITSIVLLNSAFLNMSFHALGYNNSNTFASLQIAGGVILGRVFYDVLGRICRPRLVTQLPCELIPTRNSVPLTVSSSFFLSDLQRTFYMSRISTGTPNPQFAPLAFYHPYVGTFLQELNSGGVEGLYRRALQLTPDVVRGTGVFNFAAEYQPTGMIVARQSPEPPYPVEVIDYAVDGSYSSYNWELFLHVPLLVAKRLAANQRFEDAMRWFHCIFNPFASDSGSAPQRYWIPRVFFELSDEAAGRQRIERLMEIINRSPGSRPDLLQAVAEWRADPFDPDRVAATRPVAYQKAVVMQYLATLIAWGDQLFRGDTMESINEATQLYLLASALLGPRPQQLRGVQPRQTQTYGEIATRLDAFSNAVVDIENIISIPPPGTRGISVVPSLHTFYFCIPPNEQLLGYWDTVADRLFKIRHGLNLDGVARPLALYEPPIDPGLLVRAAAAGIDISSAVADLDVERLCYRFSTVWQVAHDLCQDVRGLGAAILSALERRDAEDMGRVRAVQELAVLESVRIVKANQLAEAQANRAALQASREGAVVRRDYYASREFLNSAEKIGIVLSGTAIALEAAGQLVQLFASAGYAVPTFTAGAAGFGGSPMVTTSVGGGTIGDTASSVARALQGAGSVLSQGAGLANTLASYQRRRDDWDLQRRLAEREIAQIDKQLIAADIRIAIAQQELDTHNRQVDDARTVSEMLSSKFTNRELYDWMVSQLSSTYFQAYQLAYDVAKRASKAYAFELGQDPGYIQFGYWDSLHKGLVAGDKLLFDLRRLQVEHLKQNRRELELTKHISLAQLDPIALIRLRQTGTCFIDVPEKLFDLDQPGHFRRRLKSVSISLPAVVGPYEGIHATLTLQSHQTRLVAEGGTQYRHNVDGQGLPAQDNRFVDSTGGVEAVALSTGREDAGMFEVNFHDERYLPFEGLGAISHWKLDLPRDCNRFDVATLSDVVLHLRYTARDGGETLRRAAQDAVIAALPRAGTQLLSARTEFPDMWAQLWAPVADGQRLDLPLAERHFPPLASTQQYQTKSVTAILLFQSEQTYTDYQNSAPGERLKLHLGRSTTDGSPPIFAPDGNLGGVPSASLAVTGPIAPLSLNFLESEIAAATLLDQVETGANGTAHHRLNRALIDDVLLLVSYDIVARGSTGGGGSSGGGGSGALSSVTRDATNSNYYPASAIEWTAIMTAAGLTTGNPSSVWNLQEASGNAIDSIGGVTLTPANWTTWRAPVPGATRVCMRATDGQSNGKLFNTTTAPSPAQTSTLLVMYLDLPPAPSAIRLVAIAGDTCALRYTTTAKFQLQAGNITTFTQAAAGPRWVVLMCNNSARTVKAYTNQEKVVGVYAVPTSGPFLVLGGNNGAPAAVGYAYAAQFTGPAAELTDAQVKTLLQTLGATVSWT